MKRKKEKRSGMAHKKPYEIKKAALTCDQIHPTHCYKSGHSVLRLIEQIIVDNITKFNSGKGGSVEQCLQNNHCEQKL